MKWRTCTKVIEEAIDILIQASMIVGISEGMAWLYRKQNQNRLPPKELYDWPKKFLKLKGKS